MFDPQGTGGAGGGSTFSPSQLFASGEQGVWYDPSDFSTMFQDSAGRTPVTAIEQPVGLLLDKSKGLVLGPELVTNGDFSNGTTGWTLGNGWSISAGRANYSNATGTTTLQQGGYSTNTTYVVSFNVLSIAGNNPVGVYFGDGLTVRQPYTPVPLGYTGRFTAILNSTAYTQLVFRGNQASGNAASIDDVSVKELSGNHAYQSTTTARPILRNRYNLLTYTEQFDNAYWYKATTNVSVTANVAATTDPLGGNTADKLIATNTIGVHYTLANYPSGFQLSGQFTLSVYAKKAEYNWVRMICGGAGGLNNNCYFNLTTGIWDTVGAGYVASSETLANGWFRLLITGAVNGSVLPLIALANADGAESFAGDGTSGIYVWGASLTATNEGTIPYQWVTTGTAAGYNTDTTLFKPFLAFDGTDDFLVTSNIDFSATDTMSVFAGVRKLSDAKVGVVAELSADIAANNGTFLLSAPNSAAANYNYSSKGTTQVDNTITTYTSPITNVITGLSDISASVNIVRTNGAASTYVTSTQGTGNYGTYPLYIGWRGGVTASTQFTGRIYSLIIRNALTESTLLGQTETWVNGKTGAY